jgi:hypothetical protein
MRSFGELALLLPYHDIKLVFFGIAVKNLIDAARHAPDSLASQAGPVYTYTAPAACGGGAIQLFLHGDSPTWVPTTNHGRPDALVAANAGIGTYSALERVIAHAHDTRLPFAVTEYLEQSCEHQRDITIPAILDAYRIAPRATCEIALNPFHRPGQRTIPSMRLPNLSNGFTLVVVKKD